MIYNWPVSKQKIRYYNIWDQVATTLNNINKIIPMNNGCIILGNGNEAVYTYDFGIWNAIDLNEEHNWIDCVLLSQNQDYGGIILSDDGYISYATNPSYPCDNDWYTDHLISSGCKYLFKQDDTNVYALESNGYYWKWDGSLNWSEESGEPTISFNADKIKLSQGGLVAIAQDGHAGYLTSLNDLGSAWEESSSGIWYYNPDIDASKEGIDVVSYSDSTGTYQYTVGDLASNDWSAINTGYNIGDPSFVIYDEYRNQFIMNTNGEKGNQVLLITSNGLNFAEYSIPFDAKYCIVNEKNIVIVSSSGDISFSNNGKTWTDTPYT